MKKFSILLAFLLLLGCGGGGSNKPDIGTLDLSDTSNASSFGGCSVQFAIQSAEGGEITYESLGACGKTSISLAPGNYNIQSCTLSAACSIRPCITNTISINNNETTPFFYSCGACSKCA